MILNESTNGGIHIVSIDENELIKQMKKYNYDSDSYLTFIEERYGFENNKDYQLGNDGLTFIFNQNVSRNRIEKFKNDLSK